MKCLKCNNDTFTLKPHRYLVEDLDKIKDDEEKEEILNSEWLQVSCAKCGRATFDFPYDSRLPKLVEKSFIEEELNV